MDENSKKALRFGEAMAGTVQWAFALEVSKAAAKCGIDAYTLCMFHDGQSLVTNGGDEGTDATEYASRWADMLQAMLSHPQLAKPGELGAKPEADTQQPCCWEATLAIRDEARDDHPAHYVLRVDSFADIDDAIDLGHVGWGEIGVVDIMLVNDERAGRLPSVAEQIKAQRKDGAG